VIAHIAGLPVEEVVPVLMSGAGAWLVLKLTSLGSRRRRWSPPPPRPQVSNARPSAEEDTRRPVV